MGVLAEVSYLLSVGALTLADEIRLFLAVSTLTIPNGLFLLVAVSALTLADKLSLFHNSSLAVGVILTTNEILLFIFSSTIGVFLTTDELEFCISSFIFWINQFNSIN